MAPVARQGPSTLPNNTNPNNMTPESIQAMIDQAFLRNSTNRDGSHSSHEDNRRNVQTARPCFYADFMKCQPLNFKGTEGVVGLTRWIKKMESVFQISGCAIENQVKFVTCTLLDDALTWWNSQIRSLGPAEKINKYVSGLPNNIYRSVKASKPKTLDETIELANDLMDQKLRHFKRDFPKLKNKDEGKVNAPGWVYAVGNAEKRGNASRDPDSKVVTGTFLLNKRYASILFDTGADRCFISTAFSSLIDIVPTPLGNSYDVELADGKIVGCHTVIVCDEKLVRITYGNETLIFCGNKSNNERESRLTVISCSKAQEYMAKGCQIFLAQISTKKEEDRSKGKQLEDVPVVRDFPEVFPKDFPGLPPARPVEF
nr:hypothetical protein [Tanacetum cinerariifolium]